MQVERQKQAAKRKRSEGQSGASGKLPKRQKGAKREWWETGEPGDSEQDDDVDYYTKEVCAELMGSSEPAFISVLHYGSFRWAEENGRGIVEEPNLANALP